ncbi:MAG TPA: efflux RND transporter periplasmic adaptor subunit [Aestuariivirgaceae bacterium]|jgi:membrane fusion protein (multidrug efflux system)|nr:efflux RND transporter periplasmic adaptor subunit [Aestuariivirgaceae bacterium]
MRVAGQIATVLLLTAVLAGGYYGYQHYLVPGQPQDAARGQERAAPLKVEAVVTSQKSMARRIEAVGSTRARQSVEIVPMASGRVAEINFTSGQRVKKGETLVRLDDDIEQANLVEAQAKLQQAKLAVDRANTLRRQNIQTQASLEVLLALQAGAEAEVDRSRRKLADRVIAAPFDGVIGLRRVDPGARVTDATVIATLDDRDTIELEFSLPETVFGEVRGGLPVDATAAAFPGRHFTGTVTLIDNRIDAVGRAFKLRAELPNPDLLLPAGMFMQLAVELERRDAVTIPEEAVVVEADQAYVFLIANGKATRRDVKLGLREPGIVEITHGLKTGDLVITRGIQRVREGSPVEASQISPPATALSGGRG